MTTPDNGSRVGSSSETSSRVRRLEPVRRVVTGLDESGRSVVVSDGPSPFTLSFPSVPDYGGTDLWRTQLPADNSATDEPCYTPFELEPARGGVVFRMSQFPPDELFLSNFDREGAFGALRDSDHVVSQADVRNPTMHATNTVDFAVVVKGEIYAVLEEGEVLLRQGDTLIQRGTVHGWSNRTDEYALVAFVLVDANRAGGSA